MTNVFSSGGLRWTKQNKQLFSLDGNYAPRLISHSHRWPNPRKPCTIMEVDWRTHFLGDLIINYRLSGKLGGVQISWIPVTSQPDWRLPDSVCWWCVKRGHCVSCQLMCSEHWQSFSPVPVSQSAQSAFRDAVSLECSAVIVLLQHTWQVEI